MSIIYSGFQERELRLRRDASVAVKVIRRNSPLYAVDTEPVRLLLSMCTAGH